MFKGSGDLEAKDSLITNNYFGVLVNPSSGSAQAAIDHLRFEGNTTGLFADAGSRVTIRNSVASGNVDGLTCRSLASGSADMTVENCAVSNNGGNAITAISLSTGVVTVRVSNSTVTDNSSGFGNLDAVFLSRGNNTVEGNAVNTSGNIGSYSAK